MGNNLSTSHARKSQEDKAECATLTQASFPASSPASDDAGEEAGKEACVSVAHSHKPPFLLPHLHQMMPKGFKIKSFILGGVIER